jgi:hypothetical protein
MKSKGIRLRGGASVAYYKPQISVKALPPKLAKFKSKVREKSVIDEDSAFPTFSCVVEYAPE